MRSDDEPRLTIWPAAIAGLSVVVVVAIATTMLRSHPEKVAPNVMDSNGDACDGPRLDPVDVRPFASRPKHDTSESWTRLVMLQKNHCRLAQRLRAAAHASTRVYGWNDVASARPATFVSSSAIGPCMLLGSDFVRSVDDGEFGGGIDVVSEDGGGGRIFEGNVRVLAATSAGVIGVGGLAHVGIEYATLVAVDVVDRGPRVAALACLPAAPMDAAVDEDGTLLVALAAPWTSPQMKPDVRDMTVAVDDDGALYGLGCDTGRSGARLDVTWDSSLKPCRRMTW